MVIVHNVISKRYTNQYLQRNETFALNITFLICKFIKEDGKIYHSGKNKVCISSARCAHCMLHYFYARPGWLEVQLSGILINWTAICFCTTRHRYTGAIRRKQETAKHSALQHATLTANQHYSTATQLRLVHKNT